MQSKSSVKQCLEFKWVKPTNIAMSLDQLLKQSFPFIESMLCNPKRQAKSLWPEWQNVLAREHVMVSVHFMASGPILLARILYMWIMDGIYRRYCPVSFRNKVHRSSPKVESHYLLSPRFPLADSHPHWDMSNSREQEGNIYIPFPELYYDKTFLNQQ